MEPTNLLIIMSDQHNRKITGCYGHPVVNTPNLDRLAAHGTRFSDSYCNSPICVPSRASFATGRYVHQIRYWDNANPYDGKVPAWGHRLMDQGHNVTSIGKLHYRDTIDPNGFDEQIVPMHVVDGIGDLLGLIRDKLPRRAKGRGYVVEAGPGESTYTRYDRTILEECQSWLGDRAKENQDKPWVLFASFVCPHPPMIAPEPFYRMYPHDQVRWPAQYWDSSALHPAIEEFRNSVYWDQLDEATVRKAIAAYYGLVSFLDDNIGHLLGTLWETGFGENTRIIYTSDHGENLGNHSIWGKSVMYEDSAGVPMIISGPDIPEGKVIHDPVSLVDVFPSVIDAVGAKSHPEDHDIPGHSLWKIANGNVPERTVFSEYHASSATSGTYMIRHETFKYVHYVKFPPQLFDLAEDPNEVNNLADHPDYQSTVEICEAKLKALIDPVEIDQMAREDQGKTIEKHGGREAIINRGTFGYTPAPGETPEYK